jgi:hypothetical protein
MLHGPLYSPQVSDGGDDHQIWRVDSILKIEAAGFSKTLASTSKSAQRYNTEDEHQQTQNSGLQFNEQKGELNSFFCNILQFSFFVY